METQLLRDAGWGCTPDVLPVLSVCWLRPLPSFTLLRLLPPSTPALHPLSALPAHPQLTSTKFIFLFRSNPSTSSSPWFFIVIAVYMLQSCTMTSPVSSHQGAVITPLLSCRQAHHRPTAAVMSESISCQPQQVRCEQINQLSSHSGTRNQTLDFSVLGATTQNCSANKFLISICTWLPFFS